MRRELSFEEILLPDKKCDGSNIIADVFKLHKILKSLPIKIMGIAYLLEDSTISLDTIVRDTLFTEMIYPRLIQTISQLNISPKDNFYFIELIGWKNSSSDWKVEWKQIGSINANL